MDTINYVIIETDSTYNNTIDVNGLELVVNNTIESVNNINRIVTVLSAPKGTILRKGDKIIIHHNILRSRYDVKGKVINSDYYIEGNKYFVPLTEIYMYKRGDKDWIALDPYCFVQPIKIEKEEKIGSLYITGILEKNHKGNTSNIGIIKYPNKTLKELGIKNNDKVVFKNYSEYEFEINNQILYKMSTKDILCKIQ